MGLRTMILVATGSALMTVLALRLASEWSDAPSGNDPGRVIQGIVSGIGLLGAGAFLHAGERVRGATTGASVWLVGGIGIGCGLGAFVDAAIATAVGIVALAGLGALERKLMRTAPESGPERQHPPLSPSDRSTGPSSGP
jgi:putative Mg2+ transporter-C (MgtC) family protein